MNIITEHLDVASRLVISTGRYIAFTFILITSTIAYLLIMPFLMIGASITQLYIKHVKRIESKAKRHRERLQFEHMQDVERCGREMMRLDSLHRMLPEPAAAAEPSVKKEPIRKVCGVFSHMQSILL